MPDPFRHRLRVRFNECDGQGVVFYANYLVYFDIAITELWRETVQPYAEMQAQGVDMMVGEVTIRYLDSARFDDEIDLVATVTHLGTSSMKTAMSIERVEDGQAARGGRAAARVRRHSERRNAGDSRGDPDCAHVVSVTAKTPPSSAAPATSQVT